MLARILKMSVAAATVALSVPAFSEMLAIDGQLAVKAANVEIPVRGATMVAVEQRFGAPSNKSSSVGNPPITKWFYPNFVVVFEHDKVLHSVVVGG
jgi:hypothetical protein